MAPWATACASRTPSCASWRRTSPSRHPTASTCSPMREGTREARAVSLLAPGMRVGSFVLEEEIGAGELSVVWLASFADQRLQRRVALKFPQVGLTGAALTRFERERDI